MKTFVMGPQPPVFPYTKREAEQKGVPYSSQENRNRPFPRRFAKLRKEKDYSQQDLANALHVSKSTISLYENGDTVPDVKTIVALSELFHVTTDYLLCQTDYPTQADQLMTMESAHITEKAAHNIHDLDMIDGEGFIDYYRSYNSFSAVFSRLCEDDRFQEFVELLQNSCKDAKKIPDSEVVPRMNIPLSYVNRFLNAEEYRVFKLHAACDVLKAIVNDITLTPD